MPVAGALGCCEVAVGAAGVTAVHVDGGWAVIVGGSCCEVAVDAAGYVDSGGGCCGGTEGWDEAEPGTGDGGYS